MAIAVVNTTCDCGKVVYVSRREALVYAKHAKNTSGQLRAYRCDAGHWHLTSKPRLSKTRKVQIVGDDLSVRRDAVRRRRERQTQKRVNRAAAVAQVAQFAPKPVVSRERHTACPSCGRAWLSNDLSPIGRRCPGLGGRCTHVFTVIDPRDRRAFRWELAA